jgi:CRISPR system Cascade subunit CasE
MYLSQIDLNQQEDKGLFVDLHKLKGFVYKAFSHTHVDRREPACSQVLYRLDPDGILIVQSREAPDWHVRSVVKEFAFACQAGQVFTFRLKAFPTKRDIRTGKRIPVQRENQIDWLLRKGSTNGFAVIVANIAGEKEYIHMDGLYVRSVTYDGRLVVFDQGVFEQAFAAGIGTGKSMGCGLLSLARSK